MRDPWWYVPDDARIRYDLECRSIPAFLAWARDRIANFKCPRRAHVVPELPRNASMKVLKNDLRALARELS